MGRARAKIRTDAIRAKSQTTKMTPVGRPPKNVPRNKGGRVAYGTLKDLKAGSSQRYKKRKRGQDSGGKMKKIVIEKGSTARID
jgi:hypothetical protein